jgi:seryl-tRNA synthetase
VSGYCHRDDHAEIARALDAVMPYVKAERHQLLSLVVKRDAELRALRAEVERLTRERDEARKLHYELGRAVEAREFKLTKRVAELEEALRDLLVCKGGAK